MDDVSGLADKSDEFVNFFTVSRKYGITCLYIFHTVYPSRENWQMIVSDANLKFFFLAHCKQVQLLGFFRRLPTGLKIHTYLTETIGSTNCNLTYLTLKQNNVLQYIYVM